MTYQIGQCWDSGAKSVTVEHLEGFTPSARLGGPDMRRSAHADPEAGQRMGLRSAFAWGLMSNAYLEGLLLAAFGDAALEHGADLQVTFVKPVFAGDTIVAHVEVQSVEETVDQRSRLTLEAWCENQAGVRVTAGLATVIV
jgi:acyl dehydratase